MLLKRIAACLQPFPSNSTRKFKSSLAYFSTVLHILASPGTIAVNFIWMERARIQCWSNAYALAAYIPNYL